jgi:hypothetical protein
LVTTKSVALIAVPPGVVTRTGPVVVPTGTVVVTCVSDTTAYAAVTAWNVTLVVPVNPVPVTVTPIPSGPLPGVRSVITGVTLGTAVPDAAMVLVPLVLSDATVTVPL